MILYIVMKWAPYEKFEISKKCNQHFLLLRFRDVFVPGGKHLSLHISFASRLQTGAGASPCPQRNLLPRGRQIPFSCDVCVATQLDARKRLFSSSKLLHVCYNVGQTAGRESAQ